MEKEVDNTEFVKDRLSKIMIDPSILLDPKRYPEYEEGRKFYVPASFLGLERKRLSELGEFYGPYLSEKDRGLGYSTFEDRISALKWEPFYGKEYSTRLPEQLLNTYNKLGNIDLPDVVISVLRDELVFLATHSSVVTRLKKSFRLFEAFNVFPLVNLEKKVPPEWGTVVSGVKKWVNWIAFAISAMAFTLGPEVGGTTLAINGVRLLIIDP